MEKEQEFFEPSKIEHVINKAYVDDKILGINGHLSILAKKNYKEFNLQYNKQSVEKFLIQRAGKTTFQILLDEGLIDCYAFADEVIKNFLFVTSVDLI